MHKTPLIAFGVAIAFLAQTGSAQAAKLGQTGASDSWDHLESTEARLNCGPFVPVGVVKSGKLIPPTKKEIKAQRQACKRRNSKINYYVLGDAPKCDPFRPRAEIVDGVIRPPTAGEIKAQLKLCARRGGTADRPELPDPPPAVELAGERLCDPFVPVPILQDDGGIRRATAQESLDQEKECEQIVVDSPPGPGDQNGGETGNGDTPAPPTMPVFLVPENNITVMASGGQLPIRFEWETVPGFLHIFCLTQHGNDCPDTPLEAQGLGSGNYGPRYATQHTTDENDLTDHEDLGAAELAHCAQTCSWSVAKCEETGGPGAWDCVYTTPFYRITYTP